MKAAVIGTAITFVILVGLFIWLALVVMYTPHCTVYADGNTLCRVMDEPFKTRYYWE